MFSSVSQGRPWYRNLRNTLYSESVHTTGWFQSTVETTPLIKRVKGSCGVSSDLGRNRAAYQVVHPAPPEVRQVGLNSQFDLTESQVAQCTLGATTPQKIYRSQHLQGVTIPVDSH